MSNDHEQAEAGPSALPRTIRLGVAAFSGAIGALVLFGWSFHYNALTQILPGLSAMNPMTAICLIFASGAFIFQGRVERRWVLVPGLLIAAVGAAKLAELSLGIPFAVDKLLFASQLDDAVGVPPNRMAPNTAIVLVMAGSALIASLAHNRRVILLSQIFSLLILGITLFAVIGYVLGIVALYELAQYNAMALHSALALMAVAVGIISINPGAGLMRVIGDSGPAGVLSRYALPFVVLVPVLVGMLRLGGQRMGFYGTDQGVALQVFANVLVTFALLMTSIVALYRTDLRRRRRELAVERSENHYRLAEQIGRVGHWRVDRATGAIKWSDEFKAICGLAPEVEPSPELAVSLYHPDDAATAREVIEQAFREGKDWDIGRRVCRPNGEMRYIRSHGMCERDSSGTVVAIFGVFIDVTELELARREAEAATASKAAFLANMSHEIRTPLNSIIGFTDLLLDDEVLTDTQRRQLDLVKNSGGALLTVVDDILDFSKLDAGRVELEDEPFALATLVDNSVSIMRGSADTKGLDLDVSIDPSLSAFHRGDEARLRQVLLNLLSNAVKFTSSGSVSLEVSKVGRTNGLETLHFAVVDTGPGVPANRQERLFRQFSQADASVSRQFGGTGLGLAICKKLVELMGGKIGYQGGDGAGSTFWFSLELPTAIANKAPAPIPEAVCELVGARILLVEDLPINQELACAILRRSGYIVEVANNGAEAVEAVRTRAYDLVLMDIQMPVVDGITATRMIRQFAAPLRNIPIIAMTANVLPEQVRKFREAGMDDHVGKPIKQQDLHQAIARALRVPKTVAQPDAGEVAEGEQMFDAATFAKIAELLPHDRLNAHLASLHRQLGEAFAEPVDREQLKSCSHKMISQAGMMGFPLLSNLSREVEAACELSEPLEDPLARARAAAEEARAKIASLCQQLAA
jgi:PAS domain S-box-containing protein